MRFIITTAKIPTTGAMAYDIMVLDADGLTYNEKVCRCYDRGWAKHLLDMLNAEEGK